MSTSKTPDDKMHRYLQRIQKLVGHRGKSPGISKSRTKSPISIKTSRIDSYLKHQMFFKSILGVYQQHNRKLKNHFIIQLKQVQQEQPFNIDDYYSVQNKQKIVIKQNDQSLAVRFIIKAIQSSINRALIPYLNDLRKYQPQVFQFQDIKRNKSIHRRTYSQIYAQSSSKYQSKSPTTIHNLQYTSPQVYKKQTRKNINLNCVLTKLCQTKLLVSIIQKVASKNLYNAFSQLRSFYCKSIKNQCHNNWKSRQAVQKQLFAVKKQHVNLMQQFKKSQILLLQQQKNNQFLIQKYSQQKKSEQDNQLDMSQFQRIIRCNQGVFNIFKVFTKNQLSSKAYCFYQILSVYQSNKNNYVKCLSLTNTLKMIVNSRRRLFYTKLNQKATVILQQSRQVVIQRTHTASIPRGQSLHSSKHSFSSQKSTNSNFDIFAKKINKAFELKQTFREIYSYGFQRIDEAGFVQLTLSNPIRKMTRGIMKQSFRKILFYSFYKSQQQQFHQKEKIVHNNKYLQLTSYTNSGKLINESVLSIKQKQKQIKVQKQNKNRKMLGVLNKIEKKILYMKIQAYSMMKLNSELKKVSRVDDSFVITQVQLRRQIKDFLLQRNNMHKKTYESWMRTKQLLQQNINNNNNISSNKDSNIKIGVQSNNSNGSRLIYNRSRLIVG